MANTLAFVKLITKQINLTLNICILKREGILNHMCTCVLSRFSHVRLLATPWTVAHQAPLSMGFSRQEFWGGLPCPPPGDLPDPGMETASPVAPALTGRLFSTESPGKPTFIYRRCWGSEIISQMSLQLIFWIYFGYSNSINLDLNYWNREVGVEMSLVLTQMRKEKQCS